MTKLYASVTNTTDVTSVTVSESHNSPSASLVINAINTTLDIGNAISVDLGYADNHEHIFSGWVKQIEKQVPDNTYVITCNDEMIKAVDYFIASK
jgi:hypothetical protein